MIPFSKGNRAHSICLFMDFVKKKTDNFASEKEMPTGMTSKV